MRNAQTVEQAARGCRVGHDRDDGTTSTAPAVQQVVGWIVTTAIGVAAAMFARW